MHDITLECYTIVIHVLITQIKTEFEATVVWAESEIYKGVTEEAKPCAKPGCTPFPQCCTTDTVPLASKTNHIL